MFKRLISKLSIYLVLLTAVLFISCTDELVSDMAREKPQVIDTELESATGLAVSEGFTDSMFMRFYVMTGVAPELDDKENPDTYLENTRERVQKYMLSWNKAEGAEWYEIRASREPINEDNWANAFTVEFRVVADSMGKIVAQVPLTTAKIQSGKCINCGECVKACPFGAIETKNGKSVVDPEKCTRCGECWSSCKYDALDGLFAGSSYYFAIRSTNENGNVSAGMSSTSEPYMLRYTTVSAISDDDKPEIWKLPLKGCFGNCGVKYNEEKECIGGCFIVHPPNNIFEEGSKESVCPVDAIYAVEGDDAEAINTTDGAVFIDMDKCINCGRCVLQCQTDGYGSVTSEIVKSVREFFGR